MIHTRQEHTHACKRYAALSISDDHTSPTILGVFTRTSPSSNISGSFAFRRFFRRGNGSCCATTAAPAPAAVAAAVTAGDRESAPIMAFTSPRTAPVGGTTSATVAGVSSKTVSGFDNRRGRACWENEGLPFWARGGGKEEEGMK